MAYLASGYRSVTAWASTWAVEWRSTWRPWSLAAGSGARVASWSRGRPRSHGSPSTRAATASVVSSSSAGVVPAGTCRTLPSGSLTWISGTAGDPFPAGVSWLVGVITPRLGGGPGGWGPTRRWWAGRWSGWWWAPWWWSSCPPWWWCRRSWWSSRARWWW